MGLLGEFGLPAETMEKCGGEDLRKETGKEVLLVHVPTQPSYEGGGGK